MERHVHLSLTANAHAAKAARDALVGLADAASPEVLDDARLLVSELVTNSIRHGGLRPGDPVELNAEASQGLIRVEVHNAGSGFVSEPGAPRHDQTSGFGLYIVERLASRWGIDGGRETCVWFEIDLDGPAL